MRRQELIRRRNITIYTFITIIILIFSYRIYRIWYKSNARLNPKIIEAVATSYTEEQPLNGILLWDEQLIYAPQDGVLTYPSPRPRIVAKGEMLAALDGNAVFAPYPAYYFPGLDGQEGKWVYSKLWPEFLPFPDFKQAKLIENGTMLKRGQPVGKLIPQPQTLRCIAYLDSFPSLIRQLNSGDAYINIRTNDEGKERRTEVVAAKSSGQKLKVYLRLPFFKPEMIRSRSFHASVVTGVQHGVMIPDSAVITLNGKNHVYLLQGNSPILREIDGFPADEENFFIIKGVVAGNKLILNAGLLDESEIHRIW